MRKIKVWDGPVRLFHWTLATAFILSVYSAFQDKFGVYANMHLYAGVTVLALVSWRILWGVLGSDTARFRSFVQGPKAISAYLRTVRRKNQPYMWVGHNPLGALSVVAMLALLLIQSALGLFATDDMLFSGPLSHLAGKSAGAITEVHETIGYVLMALVGLHLASIVAYAIKRVNLVTPMLFGSRRAEEGMHSPRMASPLLALGLFVVVAVAVWLTVF